MDLDFNGAFLFSSERVFVVLLLLRFDYKAGFLLLFLASELGHVSHVRGVEGIHELFVFFDQFDQRAFHDVPLELSRLVKRRRSLTVASGGCLRLE